MTTATFSARVVVISQNFCEYKKNINEISIYTPNLLPFVYKHNTFKSMIDNSERALIVSPLPGQLPQEPFHKEIVYPVVNWGADFSFCLTNKISGGWMGSTLCKSVITEAHIKLKFYDPVSFVQVENKIEGILAFLSIIFGEKELPMQIQETVLRQEYIFSNNNQDNGFFSWDHDMLDWGLELREFGDYLFGDYLNGHIRCWDEDQKYKRFVSGVYFNLLKKNQSLDNVENKIRHTTDSLKILHERFCEEGRRKLHTQNKKTKNLPMWSEDLPSVLKDLFDCFPIEFDKAFRFKNQDHDKPIRQLFYSLLYIDEADIEGQHKLLREICAFADQMRHPDESIKGYSPVESKDDSRLFALSLLVRFYLLLWTVPFETDSNFLRLSIRFTVKWANYLKAKGRRETGE